MILFLIVMMQWFFVISYRPSPHWKQQKNLDQQELQAHCRYIGKLHPQNRIVLSGPLDDGSGGLAVLKVSTFEEAEEILEHDPAIQSGVFKGRVSPFLVAFSSGVQYD